MGELLELDGGRIALHAIGQVANNANIALHIPHRAIDAIYAGAMVSLSLCLARPQFESKHRAMCGNLDILGLQIELQPIAFGAGTAFKEQVPSHILFALGGSIFVVIGRTCLYVSLVVRLHTSLAFGGAPTALRTITSECLKRLTDFALPTRLHTGSAPAISAR